MDHENTDQYTLKARFLAAARERSPRSSRNHTNTDCILDFGKILKEIKEFLFISPG